MKTRSSSPDQNLKTTECSFKHHADDGSQSSGRCCIARSSICWRRFSSHPRGFFSCRLLNSVKIRLKKYIAECLYSFAQHVSTPEIITCFTAKHLKTRHKTEDRNWKEKTPLIHKLHDPLTLTAQQLQSSSVREAEPATSAPDPSDWTSSAPRRCGHDTK